MIIREADLAIDAGQIMVGARNFVERVAFKSMIPKDEAVFIRAVGRIISLSGFELLLAEHEDRVVGGIGILYTPYQWNPEIIVAEELFWWAAEDAPYRTGYLLIEEAMKRITERNAIPVFRKLTTSPDGVKKLYAKYGMTQVETVFARI